MLISEGTYQKLRRLLGEAAFEIRDTYALQDKVAAAAGWDDTAMDDCNDYDAHRKSDDG